MEPGHIKKKQRKQAKKRVRKAVSRWRAVLGLNVWSIWVDFEDSASRVNEWQSQMAQCRIDWPRRDIELTFWLPMVSHISDEALDKLVIHELLHGIVGEMELPNWFECDDTVRQALKDRTERVVTSLEVAVWWAYEEGKEQAAKTMVS